MNNSRVFRLIYLFHNLLNQISDQFFIIFEDILMDEYLDDCYKNYVKENEENMDFDMFFQESEKTYFGDSFDRRLDDFDYFTNISAPELFNDLTDSSDLK